MVVEATQTNIRRGRQSRLTVDKSEVPARSPNKRAEHYISVLKDLWIDLHRVPASLIDKRLGWTEDEAQRFAECAYEVCRSRNWLKLLDRATDARLIVLVLSIEMSKVQEVLADQKPKTPQQLPPPPPIRQSNQPAQLNGNQPDIPSVIPMSSIVKAGRDD